ncbi:MAG TPA: cell division protein ZipA C-terminal FtsZ-binding domain-containing protein [Steroidobacteraceae bacterium]|nr:cell division protein ZipA C-terminal FtsZ-binding domain-containing protein [Steroidobacteraceae bacterium]
MPELRIILLVVGVLFIAGIAGFEWWRSRGARPLSAGIARGDAPADPPPRAAPTPLPDINVVRDPRVAMSDSLPVIELASASESGTRRALGISISDEVAVDVAHDSGVREPVKARDEPYIGQHDDVSEVRFVEEPAPVVGPQLVLAWPNETERRIVTLRVIPRVEPRFPGRSVRQAFSAAGFWHGPLDIYHLPDESGRVVVSAAALAQPGTFDPSIMDSQRFSGLNLFAVLPGPKPERETFDELVHAARQLAERLDGTLADQHGEELTPQRIARLRQALEPPATARASGEA